MKRREFIIGAVTTAAPPIAVRAQTSAMPIIGFLNGEASSGYDPYLTAFRQGLRELSYIEGQNVGIEFRWANGQNQRLPSLADDLVQRQVAVIVTNAPAALAAKNATTKIPIIFAVGFDPVSYGLVGSLSHPGGNVTGVTMLGNQLGPKRLELMKLLLPNATHFAVLINSFSPTATLQLNDLETAAQASGLKLSLLDASSERDFDGAFSSLVTLRPDGLIIVADAYFNSRSDQLALLALRCSIPAIYQYREFTAAGGLLSYGTSLTDAFRLVGNYAGRVLKGENPADLPVQQSAKVELVVNLKTAKTLGINVPLALLGRADEVIE
jgi:putative tryptophan/tyrosine transport system substrate-binding protein